VPFYDVPVWREVSVHVDHHVSFESALYSAPWNRCPPRSRLEVRGDRQLVRLYSQGDQGVQGGRITVRLEHERIVLARTDHEGCRVALAEAWLVAGQVGHRAGLVAHS
jgi:hypothetical protein